MTLKHSWVGDIKTDLIQNSIDVIKYEISQCKLSSDVFRLSQAHCQVLCKFFEKKERDMRKKGLR